MRQGSQTELGLPPSTTWRGANKVVKSFACGSLGRSALRASSGMAAPLLPKLSLRVERPLPWALEALKALRDSRKRYSFYT
jgi:hypothetical protein